MFIDRCVGSPWNPTGRELQPSTALRQGDQTMPGPRIKRLYLRQNILEKYGRAPGCRACDGIGPTHSEACRARIEKAMIDSGGAITLGSKREQHEEEDQRAKRARAQYAESRAAGSSTATQALATIGVKHQTPESQAPKEDRSHAQAGPAPGTPGQRASGTPGQRSRHS